MNKTLLKVATFIYKPYQWFDETGINVKVYGFYGKLLESLCSSLNLDYEVIRKGGWGVLQENGTWTASFGALQSGEADMTLFPTNPFAEHLVVAEQTPGIHETDLVILGGRLSRFETNEFGFVQTFQPEVWLALLSMVLILGIFMAFNNKVLEPERKFLKMCSKYSYMLLGNVWAEGAAIPPPSYNSIRIAWMSWYCGVTIILMSAFAGQMKASMLFKPEKARLESMRDLFDHRSVRVYIPLHSAIENIMKNHKEVWMKQLYQRVLRQKTIGGAAFIFDVPALMETVKSDAVVIASRVALAKVANEQCAVMPRGEFYTGNIPISSFLSVNHMSRNMPIHLRQGIRRRVIWLRESGILSKWFSDMAGGWTGCLARTASDDLKAVSLSDLEGIFFSVLIGSLAGCLSFFEEYFGRKIISKCFSCRRKRTVA